MSATPKQIPLLVWALTLGGVGFVAGFFGPMVLDPDSNTGPIIGLLFTGPAGAVTGAILGILMRVLSVPQQRHSQVLLSACATLAIGTLYYCLPPPKLIDDIIGAQVEACTSPREKIAEALANEQAAVARVTWATPAANWRETAQRNLKNDAGAILTMRIVRHSQIYRHRKPWNSGRINAGPWIASGELKDYYAAAKPGEAKTCEEYLKTPRQLYLPHSDHTYETLKTNPMPWPATETMDILSLMELRPVPERYQKLLP